MRIFGFFICVSFFATPVFTQTVLRVPEDCLTIQNAVDEINSSQDLILVSPGVYTGAGNRDIVISGKHLRIKGDGSPESVIIDAQGSSEDPHGCFFVEGFNWATVFIGNMTCKNSYKKSAIKSQNAYVTISNCIFEENKAYSGGSFSSETDGGALYCFDSTFRNGWAKDFGGAIYAKKATVENCFFFNNDCGGCGGAGYFDLCLFMTHCDFENNHAYIDGGAIRATDYVTLRSSRFCENASERYGGACDFYYGEELDLQGCVFNDNKSAEGGAVEIWAWMNTKVSNNLFYNNAASYEGGGLAINAYGWSTIIGNTIVQNSAQNAGGGVRIFQPYEMIIENCLIWDNQAPSGRDLYFTDKDWPGVDANVFIDHSLINPDAVRVEGINSMMDLGEKIITVSPQFLDANTADFHLDRRSPCIDNGIDFSTPRTDLDGEPRCVGYSVDIGAYEFKTCMEKGAYLTMNDTDLKPGDQFVLDLTAITHEWNDPVDYLVALEIFDVFYFHPDWSSGAHRNRVSMAYGRDVFDILQFIWPEYDNENHELVFWGVLLEPESIAPIGNIARCEWSYRP